MQVGAVRDSFRVVSSLWEEVNARLADLLDEEWWGRNWLGENQADSFVYLELSPEDPNPKLQTPYGFRFLHAVGEEAPGKPEDCKICGGPWGEVLAQLVLRPPGVQAFDNKPGKLFRTLMCMKCWHEHHLHMTILAERGRIVGTNYRLRYSVVCFLLSSWSAGEA